ncbi:MAG: beta-lactamase family protein [Alphaproteobacteria bacterium]|nr:beta-lactamase family protein [Alphaproteobacteria bacterium]MDX5416893.1 beta-lactamase family protein [Alphaproteobacteria bacterium]MDX5494288.1 beta-lactamase family protein [Alphaproteobacteria bacterium]
MNFFSVGKAFTALVALRLVERGVLDLDAPAHRLWPEFGVGGKETVTLRHMLSHKAGLPAIRDDLPDGAALDWKRMTEALAAETPWWQPGTAHGYHVNTFGYLVGELVRRASGRTVGRILRDEVAGPLGADVHIGLPPTEHHRAAEFLWPTILPERPQGELDDDTLMKWNTYWNPPGISGSGWVNRPEWREAEIPSTNGHGSARGIARVYSALAAGGSIDGVDILSPAMLAAATEEQSFGPDRILERESRFALGFQLPQAERPLGPNPQAFGHFGAGGSLGFCDPAARTAFGYVTNDMGPRWQNPRNKALLAAIYECL